MPGKSANEGTEAWSTFYLRSGEGELLLKGKVLVIISAALSATVSHSQPQLVLLSTYMWKCSVF